jgi:ribosomal protein S18 acetylase RimI-like enzyme
VAEYIIRPLQKNEAEAYRILRLSALQNNPEAFGSSYEESVVLPLEAFAERIPDKNSESVIFVAEVEGKLVGMMGFLRSDRLKQKHSSSIWGVYVAPEARGHGLGRKLMDAIMTHAKQVEGLRKVTLSVITSNTAALKLYQSFGFEIWGTELEALKVGDVFYDEYHMVYFIK